MHHGAQACVHERICARVCVCTRMTCEISIFFRIFANSLNSHSLFIQFSPQFLSCGTIFFVYFIASDVAQSEAFDSRVKSKPSIFT